MTVAAAGAARAAPTVARAAGAGSRSSGTGRRLATSAAGGAVGRAAAAAVPTGAGDALVDDVLPGDPQQTGAGESTETTTTTETRSGRVVRTTRRRRGPVRQAADDVAGALLAVVVWSWVVLPWLDPPRGKSRIRAVQDVLRAKFINKGPDGEELP